MKFWSFFLFENSEIAVVFDNIQMFLIYVQFRKLLNLSISSYAFLPINNPI